ncbi:VOC family protein [Streptomyces sp. NBC_01381]|uniref:VOC family protein n=1 Tax=Streptomyces sp. NBC_01381 TaxID=2903845 RepID=UPI00224DC4AD|nr:VOC family protein [Streptomyces sp. NBC_01381]MCX4670735.1 VOC family protein [Streptomyces sp. NBC_01381]
MRSTLFNVAFDCVDAYELAQFWSKVVGHPLNDDDFPGESTAAIALPTGLHLYFAQVPEPKAAHKNRVHLCLQPDGPRDAEVERLRAAGATVAADRRNPDGTGWVVFTDPEGNEFCVLRSAAERAAGESATCDGAAG